MTPTERKLRTALVYIRKASRDRKAGTATAYSMSETLAKIERLADDAIRAIPKDGDEPLKRLEAYYQRPGRRVHQSVDENGESSR